MLGRLEVIVTWLAAVVVLGRFGPGPAEVTAASTFGRSTSSWAAWTSWASSRPDEALVLLAAGIAWLLLAWLAIAFLVVLGGAGAGRGHRWCRRAARVLVPRVVRHGLEAALGLGVAALTATPALASSPGPPVPSLDRVPATSVRLAPLPAVPAPVLAPTTTRTARTEPTPAPDPTPPPPSYAPLPDLDRNAAAKSNDPVLGGALPTADEVVVRRGDCLWDLVGRSLGPGTSDADIARAWPQWYAHNRVAIGADPDLLLPGTVLTPPSGA